VVGFDLPALFALAVVMGYDQRTMTLLLPAAEAGMVEGMRRLAKQEEE
jgi:hypothetical protein